MARRKSLYCCTEVTASGSPCKHTTANTNGNCGRHTKQDTKVADTHKELAPLTQPTATKPTTTNRKRSGTIAANLESLESASPAALHAARDFLGSFYVSKFFSDNSAFRRARVAMITEEERASPWQDGIDSIYASKNGDVRVTYLKADRYEQEEIHIDFTFETTGGMYVNTYSWSGRC